jgi:quercetin dioxygenase-like cupin family protein
MTPSTRRCWTNDMHRAWGRTTLLANPHSRPASAASSWDTVDMQKISLDALARQQMKLAATAGGRHTADTVYGGHEKVLRQTVIGMIAGARLAEHESPGEATALILHGRVRLVAADLSWDAARGDLLIMPDLRHSLEALEDSAVLLTVAKLS